MVRLNRQLNYVMALQVSTAYKNIFQRFGLAIFFYFHGLNHACFRSSMDMPEGRRAKLVDEVGAYTM